MSDDLLNDREVEQTDLERASGALWTPCPTLLFQDDFWSEWLRREQTRPS